MKRTLGLLLTILLLAASGSFAGEGSAQSWAEAEAERNAIEAVWTKLFAAMRARDGDAVLALMDPATPIVRVADDGSVQHSTGADFAAALAGMDFEPLEIVRGDVEISTDGPLTTARVPYEFSRGREYSHCGVNHFHLARGAQGWRVAAIVYSAQPACDDEDGHPGS